MSHTPKPLHGTCAKRRFRDHKQAIHALWAIVNHYKDSQEKHPVRTYECDRCNGWHLTSQAVWGQAA